MPPPSHQTFEGPNFVICSFCPRKLDFDPDAIPIPYHHSNLQSEEMIYYVDGNFSSRKGIEVGSVTLHPSGLPHGPQPGLAEKSLGMTETHEYAVMCDTFHPLRLTTLAAELDDGRYMYSWAEDALGGRPGRRHLAPLSLLAVPQPYDFELSMGRFRVFGTDLANRLRRRRPPSRRRRARVAIRPRPGGVDVEPLDDETRPVVERLLGLPVRPGRVLRLGGRPTRARPIAESLRGYRPPLQPDPFEALVTSITAQQVSLFSAVAIRNRLVERLGERVGDAWAFPTRERIAAAHHVIGARTVAAASNYRSRSALVQGGRCVNGSLLKRPRTCATVGP